MTNPIHQEIIATMEKFQKGYDERNLNQVDRFVEELFVNEDDLIIIGTGDGEHCKGVEEVRELIQIDWEYWGNFKLDLENAVISNHGEVAWVVCDGILSKPVIKDTVYGSCIKRVEAVMSSSDTQEENLQLTFFIPSSTTDGY